jgi:hypothetical protein
MTPNYCIFLFLHYLFLEKTERGIIMSKGEDKVLGILKKNKVTFDREVSFPRLIGKKGAPLRFDFAVYKNGRIIALIEFDGEQHFKYASHFCKNKSDFMYRRGCDRKKNEWALNNRVPLYRIPFWEIDNVNKLSDLFRQDFLVTSIYHNDRLIKEKFGGS